MLSAYHLTLKFQIYFYIQNSISSSNPISKFNSTLKVQIHFQVQNSISKSIQYSKSNFKVQNQTLKFSNSFPNFKIQISKSSLFNIFRISKVLSKDSIPDFWNFKFISKVLRFNFQNQIKFQSSIQLWNSKFIFQVPSGFLEFQNPSSIWIPRSNF